MVTVTFHPSVAAIEHAILQVTDNQGYDNPQTFSMSGTGH
jgi:hypothetical protein